MKTGSYEHLESYCAGKGIICQRIGKRIKLTTPDGGTTAEETSVRDAWSTVKTDPTFADLPIRLACRANVDEPKPVRVAKPEQYRYTFYNNNGVVAGPAIIAETMNDAADRAGFREFTRRLSFAYFGVVIHNPSGAVIGVRWEPV